MSTAVSKVRRLQLGPESAGLLLTAKEYDHAHFREDLRYELINGVLVVSPIPSEEERDPNEELGHWLRQYREGHRQGSSLDATLSEQEIRTKQNRRRADRVIWAGLGRLPKKGETPTIVAEFVSEGKINQERDYIAKRTEYREIGVQEYWVIDRFRRSLTVYIFTGEKDQEHLIREGQKYETRLFPGFELDLARLLAYADRWAKKRPGR
jgi:Uma2 family endonuclease